MPQKKPAVAAPAVTVLPPPDAPAPAADTATPPADAPYQVPAKAKRKRGSKADPVPPPAADPNPLLLTESAPDMPPAATEPGQEGADVPDQVSGAGTGGRHGDLRRLPAKGHGGVDAPAGHGQLCLR